MKARDNYFVYEMDIMMFISQALDRSLFHSLFWSDILRLTCSFTTGPSFAFRRPNAIHFLFVKSQIEGCFFAIDQTLVRGMPV